MGDGVDDAFYTYQDALGDLVEQSSNSDLDGNYSRFAEKALRIAMLLASLENDNQIEMRHWARAQAITERWRADLHALYRQVNEPGPSEVERIEEKILEIVERLGEPTRREIAQRISGMSSTDLKPYVHRLVEQGVIEPFEAGKTTRYRLSVE